jgi:hypothetical protein
MRRSSFAPGSAHLVGPTFLLACLGDPNVDGLMSDRVDA